MTTDALPPPPARGPQTGAHAAHIDSSSTVPLTIVKWIVGVAVFVATVLVSAAAGAAVERNDLDHLEEAVKSLAVTVAGHDEAIDLLNQRAAGDVEWRRALERRLESMTKAVEANTTVLRDVERALNDRRRR